MNTETLSKKKLKRNYPQFFVIARKYGLDKSELALAYSNGRTDSLRALSDLEFTDCLAHLVQIQRIDPEFISTLHWKPKPGDKTRKKMIAICHQMNWGATEQILIRLDAWCMDQKFKKRLMEHTPHELGLLCHILETEVLGSYLRDLSK